MSDVRRVARRALDTATLLARRRFVALRYWGKLGGSPFSMLYVGQERFAREFEIYVKRDDPGDRTTRTEPPQVLFSGTFLEYALRRARLEREASDVDLAALEVLPGGASHEDDVLHVPMFDGTLRLCASLEQQIRRMRSRGERRLMRDLVRRDAYEARVVTGADALEDFRTSMYEPYAHERFGAWAFVDDPTSLRALYERGGSILLVTPRDAPGKPVCGALLREDGPGVIDYYRNGFLGARTWSPALMAERTAALELALLKHAIARRASRLELGYARAVLNDGLLAHKHRLGCTFSPAHYAPLYRLRVRPGRRASVFARFPLVVGAPGAFTAMLGFDETAPRLTKRGWRGVLKTFAISQPGSEPGFRRQGLLQGAVVWTNGGEGAADPDGMSAFREALGEVLDLPEGIELRRV